MSSLQAIIVQQNTAEESLNIVFSNFSKEPRDTLTRLDRLNSWIEKISEPWMIIAKNHKVLLKDHQRQEVRAYLNEFRYDKIEKKTKETLQHIDKLIEKAKREAATTSKASQIEIRNNSVNGVNSATDNESEFNESWHRKTMENGNVAATSLETMKKVYMSRVTIFKYKLKLAEEWRNQGNLDAIQVFEPTLRERFDDLENKFSNIYDLMDDADEKSKIMEEHMDIEGRYLDIICCINKENTHSTHESIKPARLKLEPIEIPAFSGDLQDWPAFSEIFTSLIKNNRSLNDVQRMQYLKTCITGDATKAISQLSISSNNFEVAWKLLQTRYENERAVNSKYLDILINQPEMKKENETFYQELLDTTKECMHMLKEITKEHVILHILLQKLNKESIEKYEETIKNPKEMQTMEKFYEFLERRLIVFQSMGEQSEEKEYFKDICKYCDGNHRLFKCKDFKENLTANERKEMVSEKELCTLCLGSNHDITACKLKITCRKCNKNHNTLLHT